MVNFTTFGNIVALRGRGVSHARFLRNFRGLTTKRHVEFHNTVKFWVYRLVKFGHKEAM